MINLTGGNVQNVSSLAQPNGYLTLQLSQDAIVSAPPFGFVASNIPISFRFDSTGNLVGSCRIWSNAELSPSTQYQATFKDQNGSRISNNAIIWQFSQPNGSSVDIGTIVPAAQGVTSVPSPFSYQVIPFSPTAAFVGLSNTDMRFQMTLTGNVTAPTLSGLTPGAKVTFILIQDAVGGRTFAWPSNVQNAQSVGTSSNERDIQEFFFDGTNCYPVDPQTVN